LCDNAALIKVVLDSEKSLDMRAKSFSDLLEKYPDSDKKDEIIFRLGNELDQLNSLDRARTVLQRLVIDFPQSPFYEDALVRLGKINIRIGDYKTADSLFTTYWINFKDGKFQPEVQFIHADLLKQFGDFDGAASRFKTILKRYSFSIWADSARIHLGALYLDTGSYDKAFNLYRTALKNDSLQTWSFVAGLQEKKRSFRKVYLLGLAQACQGLNLYKKAKMYYYLYYSEYSLLNEKIRVYLALAKIAEKEGLPDRAVDYLKKVVQEMPVDSTLEAMGELYFTLGRYQEAAETFDHPITSTLPVGKQALFAARVIVSLLRQDKIPQADVRIDVYSQAYKSNPMGKDYMAEFMFERGLAYFRKKEFTAAKESFEEVLRKYKKSRFCPMAEFEIGRVYLITNKIEDALKILTDMPRRYPDNLPVLAKIYLNLGEHYYRSKQFDNALNALIMAKEYGNDSDILPVALRKLIGLYDEMGMYDAAMAITRKYIHDYPEADDILEKEVKIGNLYMKLNDFTRAVEHFRTIKKEADPDTEAEIQYWIGKSYYRMGQFEQAIFEFLKVKYLSQPTKLPWATTAMYESGISYIKLEKYQQARMLFEKIVRREGATSVLGRIARQRIQEIDDASVAVN
jgi:tetratricopeptide (TPR) repeat protein